MFKRLTSFLLCLIPHAHAENEDKIHLVGEHWVDRNATAFALVHSQRDKFHSSKDLENLKQCKNLRVLDLAHGNLTDISFLSELTELRILLLGANQIEDLSPLANLHNLEYIELFKNKVTDISPLAGLTNLLDVNLCFNKIKDFSPLYGLPKLERLWIYSSQKFNTPVPKNTVREIQQNLPYTQIDSTSYSTLGGWREHERWYVIRNMTRKAMRWLPWGSEGYTQDMRRVPPKNDGTNP